MMAENADLDPARLSDRGIDRRFVVDSGLQASLERMDAELRGRLEIPPENVAAGLLDLRSPALALLQPDLFFYAASIAKIAILLAWFTDHPDPEELDEQTRHELGLMAKASCNRMAAKYSRHIGLKRIQEVLDAGKYYRAGSGGGLWLGKHYGENDERYGDPVADHSAGATVRQVVRFFLRLEQGLLVSPAISEAMRSIFESPGIPHDEIKFVRGLRGRNVRILRKWGTWENSRHDAAVVIGEGRHYILTGLTQHARGDEYLEGLAAAADDLMIAAAK